MVLAPLGKGPGTPGASSAADKEAARFQAALLAVKRKAGGL